MVTCRVSLLVIIHMYYIKFHFAALKELSLWNKIKYLNLNIFRARCCKSLIFQTQIIWSNRINSLKYLRSTTFGSKDKVIRKSEFVAKNRFLLISCLILNPATFCENFKKLGIFNPIFFRDLFYTYIIILCRLCDSEIALGRMIIYYL